MSFRPSSFLVFFLVGLVSLLVLGACGQEATRPQPQTTASVSAPPSPVLTAEVYSSLPADINADLRYVIYIHGKIIEDEGANAVSPDFGPYQFQAILEYLAFAGLDVIGEVRSAPTDGYAYANHVADQVGVLIAHGVPAPHITVLGFSKGAGITILVSNKLRNPGVNYVLLAICGEDTNAPGAPTLTGRVLSIYEESDQLGSSCRSLAERSPGITSFDEIELATGKQHGAFFAADPAWLDPVVRWIWAAAP